MSEAINVPATLVVIGGGPIGIEAALYGRFLGYKIVLFEKGQVAESIRHDRDRDLSRPYEFNVTPLGLQALKAQRPDFQPLPTGTNLTVGEWLDQYLMPLADSDLLSGVIQTETAVTKIAAIEPDEDTDEEEAIDEDALDEDEVFDPDGNDSRTILS